MEDKIKCPECNSEKVVITREVKTFDELVKRYKCLDCGCVFS